jgi:hypothetical protein
MAIKSAVVWDRDDFIKSDYYRTRRFDEIVEEVYCEVVREFRGRPPKSDGIGLFGAIGIRRAWWGTKPVFGVFLLVCLWCPRTARGQYFCLGHFF